MHDIKQLFENLKTKNIMMEMLINKIKQKYEILLKLVYVESSIGWKLKT